MNIFEKIEQEKTVVKKELLKLEATLCLLGATVQNNKNLFDSLGNVMRNTEEKIYDVVTEVTANQTAIDTKKVMGVEFKHIIGIDSPKKLTLDAQFNGMTGIKVHLDLSKVGDEELDQVRELLKSHFATHCRYVLDNFNQMMNMYENQADFLQDNANRAMDLAEEYKRDNVLDSIVKADNTDKDSFREAVIHNYLENPERFVQKIRELNTQTYKLEIIKE